MAREPRPWRRKSMPGGPWYSTIAGEKVYLAPGTAKKSEAQKVLDRLKVERGQGVPLRRGAATVAQVVQLYLADRRTAVARGELTEDSRKGAFRFLEPLESEFGRSQVAGLKLGSVEVWVAAKGGRWNQTTRARATAMVKACFRWAKRAGHIDVNPLEDMKGPMPLRREKVMTRDQVDLLIKETPALEFRDLIQALLWTGCRPKEVYTLTADRVDLESGTWRVLDKIRRKTGSEFRTVYLNEASVELSRRLVGLHPEGVIFRNTRGRPWDRHSVSHRLVKMREALGIGVEGVAYSMRHLFATDLLQNGTPPATVAQLMGHTSLDMVMRIYSHMEGRSGHLRDAVNKPRPGDA